MPENGLRTPRQIDSIHPAPPVHSPLRSNDWHEPARPDQACPRALHAPLVNAERLGDPRRLARALRRADAAAVVGATQQVAERSRHGYPRRTSGQMPQQSPWHRHKPRQAPDSGIVAGGRRFGKRHRRGGPAEQARGLQSLQTTLQPFPPDSTDEPVQFWIAVMSGSLALGRCAPRHELLAGQPHPQVGQRHDLLAVRPPDAQKRTRTNEHVAARRPSVGLILVLILH